LRYAIFAVPDPESALAAAGAAWLGRDLQTGRERPIAPAQGIAAETLARLVAAPARSGLHASLMAPFALADGFSEADLVTAFAALAPGLEPVGIPRLALTRVDGFYALVPEHRVAALERLAARVVIYFQPFRAPVAETERAARVAGGLSAAEAGRLVRWGHPHVLDAFRFHIALTGMAKESDDAAVERALRQRFAAAIGAPFAVDRLALAVEASPGAPFRLVATVPLLTPAERAFARA
jgi:hypothetical protein